MKKITLIIAIVFSMMLSACSFLDDVNNSIDYVNEATEYMNQLTTFAEETPQLMEDALNNPEAVKELENQLLTLKQDIEEFNAIKDIPSIAEDVHQELVAKNEILLGGINKLLENGDLMLDQLENSQIFTTINEITDLVNRIESLTQ